jgi:hypothetical protein
LAKPITAQIHKHKEKIEHLSGIFPGFFYAFLLSGFKVEIHSGRERAYIHLHFLLRSSLPNSRGEKCSDLHLFPRPHSTDKYVQLFVHPHPILSFSIDLWLAHSLCSQSARGLRNFPRYFLRTFTKNKRIINTQNYNDRTHLNFINFFDENGNHISAIFLFSVNIFQLRIWLIHKLVMFVFPHFDEFFKRKTAEFLLSNHVNPNETGISKKSQNSFFIQLTRILITSQKYYAFLILCLSLLPFSLLP